MGHRERSEPAVFYLEEQDDDRRTMHVAAALAIVVHAVLFAIHLPEISSAVPEVEPIKIFVMRPIQFRPPEPTPQEIPRQNARKVPIPDPTPDAPEPILQQPPVEPMIDLPGDVLLGEIPAPPPPPKQSAPVEFHSGMVRPERIAGSEPQYTEFARRARLEGVVILRAIITREGGVRDVEIVKPLGLGLDEAAAETVAGWRFRPAVLDGRPIDVFYSLTIRFNLQ